MTPPHLRPHGGGAAFVVPARYRHRMALRRTPAGTWTEIVPERCAQGHLLGVGRMLNGIAVHPDHPIRVRTWTCTTPDCGDVTFADPEPWEMPTRQTGPSADYR